MQSLRINEQVDVKSANNDIPSRFYWRGKRHTIAGVEQSRTMRSRSGRALKDRRRFKIRTHCGMHCVLVHDMQRRTWLIEKVLNGKVRSHECRHVVAG